MHNIIVHAVIKNEKDEYLIIKRTLVKRGIYNYEGGKWDIPGGTVEELELPNRALAREVKEEVGLEITENNIIFETSQIDTQKNQIFTTLIYLCECKSNNRIKLNLEEHDEYKWLSGNEILAMKDEDLVSYMKKLIQTLKRITIKNGSILCE